MRGWESLLSLLYEGGGGAEGKREQEQEGLEEVVEARMCWCRNRT
jgi:hypothetical protein